MLFECNNITKSYETPHELRGPAQDKAQDRRTGRTHGNLQHKHQNEYQHKQTFKVLDDVTMCVDAGECVGLVGQSGAGKSTFAKVASRLEVADSGRVSFCGFTLAYGKRDDECNFDGISNRSAGSISDGLDKQSNLDKQLSLCKQLTHQQKKEAGKVWQNMQMIFQNPESSFLPNMTLEQAVAEGLVYHKTHHKKTRHKNMREDGGNLEISNECKSLNSSHKLSKTQIKKAVGRAFDMVGLPHNLLTRHAFEVSGGQCQRAAIARAIISNPKLIICDEPTSSLDVISESQIIDLLQTLHRENNMAFIFISHNLELVKEFCSRYYKMEAGRIVDELADVCIKK